MSNYWGRFTHDADQAEAEVRQWRCFRHLHSRLRECFKHVEDHPPLGTHERVRQIGGKRYGLYNIAELRRRLALEYGWLCDLCGGLCRYPWPTEAPDAPPDLSDGLWLINLAATAEDRFVCPKCIGRFVRWARRLPSPYRDDPLVFDQWLSLLLIQRPRWLLCPEETEPFSAVEFMHLQVD